MDLWDIVTEGKRRAFSLEHVCGLQGFGEIGDVCHACEAAFERSKAKRSAD